MLETCNDDASWILMWSLAFAIYAIAKLASWFACSTQNVPLWKQALYLLAWPGMDPKAFYNQPPHPIPIPTTAEWVGAAAKMLFGVSLLCLFGPDLPELTGYQRAWVGMTGVIFILHFGLFHLLSCLWRCCGLGAVPIMNWPIASQGLAEFWGRRWNLAFRDLTYKFLFMPLQRRMGAKAGLLLGFFVSGLIHDLVISVPAGAGYGLPTAYFSLQGCGILVERSRAGSRFGLSRGSTGCIYCAAIVLLPCTWLFHTPFVNGVILPFLEAIWSLQ
ncbi:MBOAT family protein [Planctomicrobium piriforme]|uniref:Membrane bound O-acyl transferase family protein n=1 Tax=Planctomicrobium piriforme TaxID=1576369 RepID=A0A1I3DKL8_9PLAN|nr:MBOAT family protein [Planctomicrobium piriforme]SFH87302.1 Membrane bound O-acyl transferase family protein [Planctomicrobium piriforme]